MRVIAIVMSGLFALASPLRAGIVAGHDYTVLAAPQPQEVKGKIEVVEFFSWGCPHCAEFDPYLTQWTRALPKDVYLARVPVTFGHADWTSLARMYYALQAMGLVEQLDAKIFKAIHEQHVALADERSMVEWLAKNGVDAKKFTDMYRSFGVDAATQSTDERAMKYQVSGVPTLAIAGKYLVSAEPNVMPKTADQLIAMERASKQAKK
jgi:thiol:disulfide interchange protein DsbA